MSVLISSSGKIIELEPMDLDLIKDDSLWLASSKSKVNIDYYDFSFCMSILESRTDVRPFLILSSLLFALVSSIFIRAMFLGKKEGLLEFRSIEFLSSGQVSLNLLFIFFFTIMPLIQVSQKVWPHMVSILGGLSWVKLPLQCRQIKSSSEFIRNEVYISDNLNSLEDQSQTIKLL